MKTKKTLIMAFVIALGLLGGGCRRSTDSKPNNNSSLSGEDIFTGIIFQTGKVGQAIYGEGANPLNLNESQPNSSDQNKISLIREIVSGINKVDPNYFNNLKEAVRSQDNYEIQKYLDNMEVQLIKGGLNSKYSKQFYMANEVLKNVDRTKYDLQTENGRNLYTNDVKKYLVKDFGGEANNNDLSKNRCLTFAFVVAAAVWEVVTIVNVVAFVNVVGAVYVAVDVKAVSIVPNNGASQLTREIIVQKISKFYSSNETEVRFSN